MAYSNQNVTREQTHFTLLEIIIVLVIFGLVLGILAPRLGHISSGIIRSDAIKNIKSSFYMASSIAAATGKPVKLKFDIEEKSIDINHSKALNTSHADDDFDTPGGSIFDDLKQFKLPGSTEIDPNSPHSFSENAFEYSFYPNGEAAGPKISILIEQSIILSIDIDRLTGKPVIAADEFN